MADLMSARASMVGGFTTIEKEMKETNKQIPPLGRLATIATVITCLIGIVFGVVCIIVDSLVLTGIINWRGMHYVMNIPIGAYTVLFGLFMPLLVIPFPKWQIHIPVLKYFHDMYLVKGIIMFVLALPMLITTYTVLIGLLIIVISVVFIFCGLRGEVPNFKKTIADEYLEQSASASDYAPLATNDNDDHNNSDGVMSDLSDSDHETW